MKTGTKIALWVTGIAVAGVGGYFIWREVKKAREKKAVQTVKDFVATADKITTDSLSKPLSQLIPNTQPKGFGPQSGGFGKPNLTNRGTSSIYQPLNLNFPNKV